MKKVLITGANFNNKGAQSMLFITVDELKKRIPDCDIYFATSETREEFNNLNFQIVHYANEPVTIALGRKGTLKTVVMRIVRNIAKRVTGRKDIISLKENYKLKRIMPTLDLILDISGFGIGTKWGIDGSEKFLDRIRLAQKYNVPIILLPQSFGPFNFNNNERNILSDIKKLFQYPLIIFTREENGYQELTRDFKLTNVVKSTDLVLQNCGISIDNIYKNAPDLHIPCVCENESVAFVPNMQCNIHGDPQYNYQLYKKLLDVVLGAGKNVYIIRHAGEDLQVCKQIYKEYESNSRVHLLAEELSCLEYNELVKNFDFIVCSRFHGIVHAYKNAIPALVLGWAIKYNELADCVGQNEFVFDITDSTTRQTELILNKLELMIDSYTEQRRIILSKLTDIQRENCFNVVSDYIENKKLIW